MRQALRLLTPTLDEYMKIYRQRVLRASDQGAHKNLGVVLLLPKPHLWDFAMSDGNPFHRQSIDRLSAYQGLSTTAYDTVDNEGIHRIGRRLRRIGPTAARARRRPPRIQAGARLASSRSVAAVAAG